MYEMPQQHSTTTRSRDPAAPEQHSEEGPLTGADGRVTAHLLNQSPARQAGTVTHAPSPRAGRAAGTRAPGTCWGCLSGAGPRRPRRHGSRRSRGRGPARSPRSSRASRRRPRGPAPHPSWNPRTQISCPARGRQRDRRMRGGTHALGGRCFSTSPAVASTFPRSLIQELPEPELSRATPRPIPTAAPQARRGHVLFSRVLANSALGALVTGPPRTPQPSRLGASVDVSLPH